MHRPKRIAFVLALLATTIAAAGCELQAGTIEESPEVDSAGIEQSLAFELGAKSGVPPKSVSCPDEMVAREGQGYECTVVHPRDGGQTVVVKMHADGGFRWDVPVDW